MVFTYANSGDGFSITPHRVTRYSKITRKQAAHLISRVTLISPSHTVLPGVYLPEKSELVLLKDPDEAYGILRTVTI
jgi:hypothetical protein